MRLHATIVAGLTIVSIGVCGAAQGQEALYGKQPPRGSAFVRFVNATPGAALVTTDYQDPLHLGAGTADRVAQYTVVEKAAEHALTVTAKAGAHEGRFTYKAPADGYVTILLEQSPSGAISFVPVVDQAEFNQTRARLAFYNGAVGCAAAALGLDPSGPAVFQDVAPGTSKSRTVNPVQANVRASCSGQPGPVVALGGMELGASYSIWLMQPGAQPILFLTPDLSAKYKPKS